MSAALHNALASPASGEAAAAVAAAAPARIGPYRVLGALGQGTMGVVWLAHDERLQRTVALKTIQPSRLSPRAAQRLQHEAQAAARLSHPGIVSIHEYGQDGETAYIAMEHVSGIALSSVTTTVAARGQTVPLDDVLALMAQLLAALQCAHEQGVCHGDIKPANLLVTRDGRLKIADFGVARIDAAAPALPAGAVGTPGYMAPECFAGAGIDHRADLYACGVLLHELLLGMRPFRGSFDSVMAQTLHATVPALPTALRRFEAVVQRALAKTADERFACAQEMLQALLEGAGRPAPVVVSVATMQSWQAMPTARPAPAPQPSASITHAPIAPELAQALIGLLAQELGPLAGCLVRRAAATSASAAVLVRRIADEALPPSRRESFIESARALVPDAAAAPQPTTTPPLLGETPLEASLVEAARALLAPRYGAVAAVMVRRAAKDSATRERFIERLSTLAAEGAERDALTAALCRLR